jgi:hypothetical protein
MAPDRRRRRDDAPLLAICEARRLHATAQAGRGEIGTDGVDARIEGHGPSDW